MGTAVEVEAQAGPVHLIAVPEFVWGCFAAFDVTVHQQVAELFVERRHLGVVHLAFEAQDEVAAHVPHGVVGPVEAPDVLGGGSGVVGGVDEGQVVRGRPGSWPPARPG